MASTYSNLKIQLMATGENASTWGDVTNTNLGTAIEEAIAGSADVTFAGANVTLTLSDTNGTQTARNMRLNLVGTTGGSTRNLVVPSIEKAYIVNNTCEDSVVIKTSAGTGVTIPAGKTAWVYNNATNVVDVVTHLTSVTLGSPLPVASGGTGSNTGNAGSLTGFNASNVTTGTLAVSYGGTGAATAATARVNLLPSYTGNGGKVLALNAGASDTEWISVAGAGTVTSVNANSSVSGLSFSGGPITSAGTLTLSGTLGVQGGGTGTTSLTSGAVLIGNGTSAVTSVSPGTAGNVLVSTGSAWASSAAAAAGVSSLTAGAGIALSGSTGAITITNTGAASISAGTGISVSAVGGAYTVTNSGVTSIVAGSGITISGATGSITISASGGGSGVSSFNTRTGAVTLSSSDVTTALGYTPVQPNGTGASGTWSINISGSAGSASTATSATTATTATTANALNTSNNYQVNSLGVGTAGSGTTGEIRATNNITAYYSSDITLKENVADIESALDKVRAIGGKTFDWTDEYIEEHGGEDEYFLRKKDFGVIAQDVEAVFPVAVRKRTDGKLAVDYEKLCALAFQAIKELEAKVEALTNAA